MSCSQRSCFRHGWDERRERVLLSTNDDWVLLLALALITAESTLILDLDAGRRHYFKDAAEMTIYSLYIYDR